MYYLGQHIISKFTHNRSQFADDTNNSPWFKVGDELIITEVNVKRNEYKYKCPRTKWSGLSGIYWVHANSYPIIFDEDFYTWTFIKRGEGYESKPESKTRENQGLSQ
jgi:hypothetical protein